MKVVVIAHLYGTPGKIDELRDIFNWHGAVIVEDAAESLGATYKGVQLGVFHIYNAISFIENNVLKTEVGEMGLKRMDKNGGLKKRYKGPFLYKRTNGIVHKRDMYKP